MSGALLLYAWYQYRETKAALWWAGADLVLACAIVFMAAGSGTENPMLFKAGLTMLCASAALTWAGARAFDGYRISPLFSVLGTALWLAAQLVPVGLYNPGASSVLNAAVTLIYYATAAARIRIGNGEPLNSRLPLVILLLVHALTLFIAVPASLTITLAPHEAPPVLSWFGIIHFETLVFAIGTAIFMVLLMKERSEGRQLAASHTDVLTGLANRRGFFEKANRIVERCKLDGAPIAVIVIDLDRFKGINDRYGHVAGDSVLQMFAVVCGRIIRPGDLMGRIGGEEFALVLPGTGIEAGFALAERLRGSFAESPVTIEGAQVWFNFSAGVTASAQQEDIHAMIQRADVALYRAKETRNRVERFAGHDAGHATQKVIRIA